MNVKRKQEKRYNPFYGLLAAKLCSFNHNFKYTFQLNFWDRFKALGEYSAHKVSNLAQLLADLLSSRALSFTVFKTVDFTVLVNPVDIAFFRMVFTSTLLKTPEVAILQFKGFASREDKRPLCDSLLLMIQKGMKKLDSLIDNPADLKKIRDTLKILKSILGRSLYGF